MHSKLAFLFLMVLCTGCSALKKDSNIPETKVADSKCIDLVNNEFDAKLYQLFIGKKGDLQNPITDKDISDEDGYISSIFNNYEKMRSENKCEELQLIIYVHGGLNSFNSATSRVNENIVSAMLADGKYPLFISWNAEGPSNYWDHLLYLRRGTFSEYFALSSPFVFIEDIARSVARIPASTYNVFTSLPSETVGINLRKSEQEEAKKQLEELRNGPFKIEIHDGPKKTEDEELPFKDWWSILNPLKLVTAPFVDEFGSGTWGSLLRRTDMVLHKETFVPIIVDPSPAGTKQKEKRPETAVSKFLNQWQDEHGIQKKGTRVVLIGHSMGTIITNNIIAKYQNINFSQIVYMAAACSIKDIEHIIAPYLKKNKKAIFYNLSLNPKRDIMENFFYDIAPRGSLLVWIDQTLASINSFQDRTAGFWYNMVLSADHIFDKDKGIRKRVHLTMFGINDGSPQKHGDFDDCPYWREKFWMGDLEGHKCK